MTKGMKTSEFYVALAAMAAGLLAKATGWDIDAQEFGMIWGPAFAYIGARGLRKINLGA